MAPQVFLSRELDRVIQQANSTAVQLAAIGVEMRAIMFDERHDPGLSATVLASHAKRAALAVTSLAGFYAQIDLLARLGAR